MVNQKLLAALKEKGWSIEIAAARIGIGRVTFSRWVHGHQHPQPALLELLCEAFGKSASDLGYEHLSKEPAPPKAVEEKQTHSDVFQNPLYMLAEDQLAAFATLLKLGDTIMFDPTKRKTLETILFALTGAMIKPSELLQPLLSPEADTGKANEVTLLGFEKLIEACWQFSRGNELALAEKLLPECMTKLVPLAQEPSKYQQVAATLAAQGFHLYSILALHRNNTLAQELYAKQAVQYSTLAEDYPLLISSLKRLGDTYYYVGQYMPALRVFQDSLQYAKKVSPLLKSKIYTSLAVAYAYIDQRQESLQYLGLALDTFPDNPEADASFSYAEFDLSQLILWEGITRSQLGQTKTAIDIFNRIDQPEIIIPERIRIEIINQQAKTALVSGDLEQGLAYVEAGVTGAKTLGSQRRYNEAYDNFKQACLLWPQEKQVKELGELFH